jgi:cytoskeleton protein RodZ
MDEPIGARLRAAREQRRLTIEEVSEATRLRPHYVEALERGELSALPSTAQARGFLRIYAEFLGLAGDDLLSQPRPQNGAAESPADEAQGGLDPKVISEARLGFLDRLRGRASRRAPTSSRREARELSPTAASPTSAGQVQPDSKKKSSDLIAVDQEVTPARADSPAETPLPAQGPAPAEAADTPATQTGLDLPSREVALAESRAAPRTRDWVARLLGRRRGNQPEDLPQTQPSEDAQNWTPAEVPPLRPSIEAGPVVEEAPAPPPAEETETSEQIFADIGSRLRQRREMLSLTHEEIERYTRVRAELLDALEHGSLEELPSPVQTRGILANYASFLDLDSDAILLRFADALQARHREQKPQLQSSATRQSMTVHTTLPPLRSFIASDLLFGIGVAALLLLFSVWGISRVMSVRNSSPARATSVSIAEVLAGTPQATIAQEVTLIPAQDTVAPSPAAAALPAEVATLDSNAAVQIGLTTSERTYVRITVDGKIAFEGRTEPAAEYTYQGNDRIEILVGNASALRVTYNGRDLGMMGNFGQVIDLIYTAQGVETPTPTLAPTPTASPHRTATPSQTSTPTPSVTPTPKPGG